MLRDLHWLPVGSRIDLKLCLYYVQGIEKKLLPFTSRMSSVSMNLKDPYARGMIGPYTLLVLGARRYRTLFCNQGASAME